MEKKKQFESTIGWARQQRLDGMSKKDVIGYWQQRYDHNITVLSVLVFILFVCVFSLLVFAADGKFCSYDNDDVMVLSDALCDGQDAGEFISGKVNAEEGEAILFCEHGTIKYVRR